MAKKTPLTKSEKSAITRQKKQELALDQLGIKIKKPRKRRKPMTDEQKAAAVERLKLARAARGPVKNSSVHEDIRDLPDDHPLNPTTVKEWIKEHKKELGALKSMKTSNDWQERFKYQVKAIYLQNMESYLRGGVWLDARWGKNAEFKMNTICYAMAFDSEGMPKRSVGTWYPDMRMVYTKEMRDLVCDGDYDDD